MMTEGVIVTANVVMTEDVIVIEKTMDKGAFDLPQRQLFFPEGTGGCH